MSSPTLPGNFAANLFPVGPGQPLNTGNFVTRTTPGNVAVCLSGGGSRALSAGMGQLQALEMLQANGASLLSQVRAISTVSGGGWVGIPFVYLQGTSDSSYLGPYVDPGNLTLDSISSIPSSQIGSCVTSDFSIPYLALEALYLYCEENVTPDMLWQTLMGLHILQPYGLFTQGADMAPASLFSYDSNALIQYVTGPNPSLASEPANLIAEVPGQQRPYLVCNCGMFVTAGGQAMLAPVQSTPFTTGIMSTPPNAVDANNRQAGGGGVTSFAFSSAPSQGPNSTLSVQQSRQWSLVDAMGTSSAAFAAEFKKLGAEWSQSPTRFRAAVRVHGGRVKANLAKAGSDPLRIEAFLQSILSADTASLAALQAQTGILQSLIPAYQYWPVQNVPYGQTVATNEFADGGLLENCGIASILAYSDIDNIIAFVNSSTELQMDGNNVIVVDDNIPPLFGFQPYQCGVGYLPYANATAPLYYPYFQNNQVFDSNCFQPLLNQLWAASGSGSGKTAPIVSQPLTTLQNDWFGVSAGKPVTVLWVHLQNASDWYDSFDDILVRGAMDLEIVTSGFPHYNTLETELSPIQVNLLSNLTAWTVAAAGNAGNFTSMFTTSARSAQAGG